MVERYETSRLRVCSYGHRGSFEGFLNPHYILTKEEETACREILLGASHVTDGSGGSNLSDGVVLQAKHVLRLGSRPVASQFRIAAGYPSFQRLPSDPVFGAAPPAPHAQDYGLNFTLPNKIEDAPTGRARHPLRLVRGHLTRAAPHGRRKVAMLTADQALPILGYELLEGVVKESELAAGKDTKQVR